MNEQTTARVELLRSSPDYAIQVFTTILTQGPISRTDVARRTGLTPGAVTRAVTALVAEGLVDDTLDSRRDGLPGRPVAPVAVMADALVAIGVKVNADELIGIASDMTTHVLAARRVPLPSHEPNDVTDAIVAMCEQLQRELGGLGPRLACIGIAVSGDVDTHGGTVRESALMGWAQVDLGARLSRRITTPVVVENDVRALTIGEHWFGVGVGTRSFAIVTIGRGVGSGLHLNGEVVEGTYGVAGEIGHLPLMPPDRICACGRRGCVEAVAATSAIVAAVSAAHGRPVTIDQAVRLAHDGDGAAAAAFGEAGAAIGAAVASLVNLVGPELVIIGGEATAHFELYRDRLYAAYAEHVFGSAVRARIIVRPHTFEDWARGAAASAIRALVT